MISCTLRRSIGFGHMILLIRSLNSGDGSFAKRFQNLFVLFVREGGGGGMSENERD